MSIYGEDFADAYNERWAHFGPRMWPFLSGTVAKRKPDARTWLDVCCGTGSLLKLACENGFTVVGVDISPHQLRHARKNAPGAELVEGDMRDLRLGRKFDVVTCLFDSVNYMTTGRDLERAFRCARRHLADKGLFMFDIDTVVGMRRRPATTVGHERHRTIIVETRFDEKRAISRVLITGFVKQGRLWRRWQEEHVQRGYSAEETERLLARARLTFRKYDARTFSRPRKRSGRLLYVCQKR